MSTGWVMPPDVVGLYHCRGGRRCGWAQQETRRDRKSLICTIVEDDANVVDVNRMGDATRCGWSTPLPRSMESAVKINEIGGCGQSALFSR
jgi:hypothetical protein